MSTTKTKPVYFNNDKFIDTLVKKKFGPTEFHKEMLRRGYDVSYGTVYKIFTTESRKINTTVIIVGLKLLGMKFSDFYKSK